MFNFKSSQIIHTIVVLGQDQQKNKKTKKIEFWEIIIFKKIFFYMVKKII
jgi:hypothetical protein